MRRIGVVIGEPLDFSRFEGMEGDRFILRSITDEIMYELQRLSGQEYVDVYASSVKEQARKRARAERSTASGVATRQPIGSIAGPRRPRIPSRTAEESSVVDPSETRRARRSRCDRRSRLLADAAHQAAAGLAGRRGRRRGIRRDRDAAAAGLRRRGRHPARAARARPRAARRSCCRAATAPRPSPARRPSRSATGSRRCCRWRSCSPTARRCPS